MNVKANIKKELSVGQFYCETIYSFLSVNSYGEERARNRSESRIVSNK